MKDHPLDPSDLTWLSGLARALLGEAHAAEDLVQETAVAALEGPIPRDAPRRAWLASVARRLAARRFRGDARRARREELVARFEGLPDSAELVEKAEIAEQVTAAARRLPEPYRRTILLRFLEGRSVEEIARDEGKPADTVRWRVRRGLELLREELVESHGRDWSSWSVLLLPLARQSGDVGLATAGASGVFSGMVVPLTAMKVTLAVAVVLSCAGLWLVWDSEAGEPGDTSVAAGSPNASAPLESPARGPDPALAPVASGPSRTAATAAAPASTAPLGPQSQDLLGMVFDEEGEPVAGATVYLIPSIEDDQGGPRSGPVRARTESDERGTFRFSPEDWKSGAKDDSSTLDLGVTANGYLRTVLPDALTSEPRGGLVVVLRRGRTLTGRVVDELGHPVPGLELLAHTAYAGIDHVSPSRRRLLAERSALSGASSKYEGCRATTDGRGEVWFTGLPADELRVRSLDPGWVIEEPARVEAGGPYVEWTAKSCLGARLIVVDRNTGRPVETSSATFRFECTFADGEVIDLGQWVGSGAEAVSFVFEPDQLPGIEDRTITRAAFYGTARSGGGQEVKWVAEPIEDEAGATGVAEVRVEVDPSAARIDASGSGAPTEEPGTATLELDVRYDDYAPFEGELSVRWISKRDPSRNDGDRVEADGPGRYRIDMPVGAWTVEVADRFSSGSLSAWTGEVRLEPDRGAKAFVTLPRGATAKITRPDGWKGEWFVRASWRPPGEETWRGSWGYSTAGSSLTLGVLRPAEWRFELRRDSALERDPLVRTVALEDGESAVVDE